MSIIQYRRRRSQLTVDQPRPIKSLVDKEGWTPEKLLDSAFPAFEAVGQDLGATVSVFPYEPF